jgi:hypothetical protein
MTAGVKAIQQAGVDPNELRCEVGLSDLAEWMNLRIYFPDAWAFDPGTGDKLALRLECFNAVEGSARLVILFGWLRFVCSNGMVIGDTRAEIRDIHNQRLDLDRIPEAIATALRQVKVDIARMDRWRSSGVPEGALRPWVNGPLSERWGKKAAARVYHICTRGQDVGFADPFAPGAATEKPTKPSGEVPGSESPARTLFDVSQALSWVATRRNNAEKRVERQSEIAALVQKLHEFRVKPSHEHNSGDVMS